jgi:hypothetical protein
MPTIRQILKKVVPKLQAIEENPTVEIIRISGVATTNPFTTTQKNEVYDVRFTVPCIYSEQPEIVRAVGNITTDKAMYLFIQTEDILAAEQVNTPENITGKITKKDRFIFKEGRYMPIEVQEIFGLWKIKVDGE